MDTHARTDIKEMEIQAVVTRADGTKEDLGVVSYYHRNPLVRLWKALKNKD